MPTIPNFLLGAIAASLLACGLQTVRLHFAHNEIATLHDQINAEHAQSALLVKQAQDKVAEIEAQRTKDADQLQRDHQDAEGRIAAANAKAAAAVAAAGGFRDAGGTCAGRGGGTGPDAGAVGVLQGPGKTGPGSLPDAKADPGESEKGTGAGCQLSAETSGRLLAIAKDADEVAEYARACRRFLDTP